MKNKINKIFAIALFIFFVGSSISAVELGDFDKDNEITSFDAYKVLELSNEEREFTKDELETLDIDKDGAITSFDAYLILSYSIGIDENGYWNIEEVDPEEEIFNSYYNPVESKYYYNQLNDDEKKIYDTLYNNKNELKDEKRYDLDEMPHTTEAQSDEIYWNAYYAYKYDNPDTFYMQTYSYSWREFDDDECQIASITPMTYKNILDVDVSITELEKARREAIVSLTSTNDFEMAFQLHNYLVKGNTYDYRVINTPGFEDVGTYTAYGALVKGKSVCEGYAMAYKYLLNAVGIECEIITGAANGGGHAWNAVKLNGVWYYVDTTWDDPIDDPEYVGFSYFLIGSEKLEKDHVVIIPTDRFVYPTISKIDYAI